MQIVTHSSNKLGFNISLPSGWKVFTDVGYSVRDSPELSNIGIGAQSAETAYQQLKATFPEAPLIDFEDFKRQYEHDMQDYTDASRRHACLEEMRVGLFQASPPDSADHAWLEIVKLRLRSPLTSLDIYKMDKHPHQDVPWGSRPSKGMVVDGLQGVVYYFALDTEKVASEIPVFFNVYLADGNEGWIISCSSK